MSGLRDFLMNEDIGVTSTGDEIHTGLSLLETIISVVDATDLVVPTILGPVSFASVTKTVAYSVI
jgi:hypothetical protein